jgi:hypothetical protein
LNEQTEIYGIYGEIKSEQFTMAGQSQLTLQEQSFCPKPESPKTPAPNGLRYPLVGETG